MTDQAARATNQTRVQAMLAAGLIGKPKLGLVTSYDPDTYCAKVKLQPENVETGWLPIGTQLAGNGWGFQAGPSSGDQAVVAFEEGDQENGVILCFLYSDEDRPIRVESGEMALTHKDGQGIRLRNGGQVQITGNVSVEGSVAATGNLSAGTGVSGTFTTPTGLTVTVQDGIIVNIF